MPALSARFDPDSTAGNRDVLDIRTRLLISLVVTSVTLYLSSNATLAAMSAHTATRMPAKACCTHWMSIKFCSTMAITVMINA